jgi:hypothetical protein
MQLSVVCNANPRQWWERPDIYGSEICPNPYEKTGLSTTSRGIQTVFTFEHNIDI